MILPHAIASNALVTGCHYLIPIPAFSALYPILQHTYHLPVLVTPIFDVRESNGKLFSCLRLCHRCQTGPKTSLALSFILLVCCPVLPFGNRSLGCTGTLSCSRQHSGYLPLTPMPTMPSLWVAIFLISTILNNRSYVYYQISIVGIACWCSCYTVDSVITHTPQSTL